ncbi:histidine kinase dimerization/phospho-acceptor domain-containing protein [Arcanobacterium pinnipediorum]|uniref:histidine kinase dimerization/phospho-acceptor domain-containing protein n=1 Tax=Arcanobacterium pinnipediorum TaxID=1503041 RepID=UPI00338F1701
MLMAILLVTLTTLCGISTVMCLWTYRLLRKTRQQNATLQQRVLSNLVCPAYLSHEIRTPLTVINGASEILTTGDLGPISSEMNPCSWTVLM